MAKKEDALYQAWLEEVKAKLPADALPHFEALTQHESASREVFKGGYREADYYRRLNELNEETRLKTAEISQKQKELDKWYADESPKNARLIAEKEKLERQLQSA